MSALRLKRAPGNPASVQYDGGVLEVGLRRSRNEARAKKGAFSAVVLRLARERHFDAQITPGERQTFARGGVDDVSLTPVGRSVRIVMPCVAQDERTPFCNVNRRGAARGGG